MLADLADEGDDVDEDRQQERAKIEDTIRATDAALASKDREIAELKSRIADGKPQKTDSEEALQQLLDSDEVIAEHRARIAKLEVEMTAKLRDGGARAFGRAGQNHPRDGSTGQLRAEIEVAAANQGVDPRRTGHSSASETAMAVEAGPRRGRGAVGLSAWRARPRSIEPRNKFGGSLALPNSVGGYSTDSPAMW